MSISVLVSAGALDVRVGGWDRVWGLRSRIEVPLARVRDARVVDLAEVRGDRWLRTGGLGVPGVASVGHFRGREAKRQWWRVYRAARVLVIELTPESHFDRIVLPLEDPDAVAARIREALPPRSGGASPAQARGGGGRESNPPDGDRPSHPL